MGIEGEETFKLSKKNNLWIDGRERTHAKNVNMLTQKEKLVPHVDLQQKMCKIRSETEVNQLM